MQTLRRGNQAKTQIPKFPNFLLDSPRTQTPEFYKENENLSKRNLKFTMRCILHLACFASAVISFRKFAVSVREKGIALPPRYRKIRPFRDNFETQYREKRPFQLTHFLVPLTALRIKADWSWPPDANPLANRSAAGDVKKTKTLTPKFWPQKWRRFYAPHFKLEKLAKISRKWI